MSVVPFPRVAGHRPPGGPAIPRARSRVFPRLSALLDPTAPYLIPLVVLVASRAIMAWLLPMAAEDAYITYRYARNLALGLGPVFNPGERVMGFTSPLWTAWNALGWWLTHDPVTWSRVTAIAADALALVLGAGMLARYVSRASAWCFAFAFAAWTASTAIAISGMESSLFVCLLLIAAALADRGSVLTGPVLAALALTRPEGILAAAIIAIGARWRDRAVALILAGAAFAGLAAYYGSPLPQSVIAKARLYGTPGPWAGRHWWEWAFPFALGRWPLLPDGRFLYLVTVIAAPAALVGLRSAWRRRRTALGLAVGAALAVWLGYALSGAVYFFWYLAVPLLAWFLLAAAGLPRIVRGGAVYASAALLLLGCWTVVWELHAGRARAEEDFARVADYLAAHSSPWQKVLLEPIGIVGYRVKLVVLDEVGLVSPKIAERRMRGPGWMTDVVAVERPEWLVLRRGVLERMEAFAGAGAPFRQAAERDALLAAYAPGLVVDEAAGDNALIILRRRLP